MDALSARSPQRPWVWTIVAVAALVSLPVLVILSSLAQPASETWEHIKATVLGEYLGNTALLALGVSAGTLVLGVSTAWLTAMCRFPGRDTFVWLLLLPLAMPAYIIAYTYTGLLDFAGPVQTALRAWTGWGYGEYYFPDIRSLGGAATLLSLVLYPYVYLLTRAAFLEQSVCVLEVSRTLGCNAWTSFSRVAIPLARPAVVAGLSLALMETLADYGTVAYFGIGVFTTGIFRTWFGLGDAVAASKMASLLLLFVFALIALERISRRQAHFHHTSTRYARLPEYELRGARAVGAFIACLVPVLLGFLVPATQLAAWAIETYHTTVDARFVELASNSLLLAFAAALLSAALALFFAYGRRLFPGPLVRLSLRTASLGYALPGTVIAVGIIIPFAWLDRHLDALLESTLGFGTGLLLSGTVVALLFAYLVRFLAISLQAMESGLGKIRPSMEEAARSLGVAPARTFRAIHVPLMRGTVLTALLIVFVDVMKELPATMILRPFDFNTLAVRAFELASDERLADSSTAALAIVALGILPVILLSRTIAISRAGHP